MNKRFQKGLAVSALTAMVVAPFAHPVYAVGTDANSNGLNETEESTLNLKKDLTVRDLDDANYTPETPNVTFGYTVSNGEAGTFTSKQDDKGDQVFQVKAGKDGNLVKVNGTATTGNVVFTQDDTASQGKVTKDIALDFSGITFTEAGIYRYVITEADYTVNDNSQLTNALPQTTANKTRNVDVYVEQDGDAYKIKGYVVSKTSDSTGKDAGFTEEKTEGNVDPTKSSVYSTYDVTLTKKVDGVLTNNAGYSFTITLPTDDNGTYGYQKNSDSATTVETTNGNNTHTVTLAKNDTIKIQGLPVGATIDIAEDHVEGFKLPTITVDDAAKEMTNDDGAKKWKYSGVGSNDANNDATDVVITNKTENDSILPPTGILMTIAPFAAMVGLGAALIALFAKKRKNEA
ncbi:hypothetical protein PND92_06345 [Faecalicoccus pleomorphus]|uniref:DUF7601 domain-containing protein n=1 Tax=Faecalicoccus pleomorphus TaxID=1323 RepID=UPI00232FEA36|nr:hypothetical protein [Faecalicoccus pleomorphus]MDB7989066.1 hypothetical protein [Faecalicoccus pleomorphus]MDB7993388.1 hypothetical protein [Faecalicoccus pleomorphus]